jgi:hypothetical protein
VALNLFGVTVNDAHMAQVSVADIRTIAVRDLAAICGPTEYREADLDEETITRHSDVVAAFAARGPMLPAPVGVVFRSPESVERWLELHYGALTEALTFVENRVAARVHISRPAANEEHIAGIDIDAVASNSLRILVNSAVATLPLRVERAAGAVLSAAFLIEQDQWMQFVGEVEAQAQLAPGVRFELTGPWPPFDFVQMQLGG